MNKDTTDKSAQAKQLTEEKDVSLTSDVSEADDATVAAGKKRNLLIAAIFGFALVAVIAAALMLQSGLLTNYDPTEPASVMSTNPNAALVGEAAPNFEFLGEQGHRLLLSDFAGTPIVLNFWASWCPPCRMEKPFFQEAFDHYGNEVKFIVLNIDEPIEVARAYADEEGFTFPLYFDEMNEGAAAFGVTGVPETFFINADGIVEARFLGAINFATIEHSIQSMLE